MTERKQREGEEVAVSAHRAAIDEKKKGECREVGKGGRKKRKEWRKARERKEERKRGNKREGEKEWRKEMREGKNGGRKERVKRAK